MLVREVMSTSVRSVSAGAAVDEAMLLLSTHRITSLPVVDGEAGVDGRVVGILSEADVLRHVMSGDPRASLRPVTSRAPAARVVRELMTAEPYLTRPGADVREVAEAMLAHGWKSVPVVDAGALVGVLSRSDVVRALSRGDEAIAADLAQAYASIGRASWQVRVDAGVAQVTGPVTAAEQAIARSSGLAVLGVRDVVCPDAVS